jgi:hypothetical protein
MSSILRAICGRHRVSTFLPVQANRKARSAFKVLGLDLQPLSSSQLPLLPHFSSGSHDGAAKSSLELSRNASGLSPETKEWFDQLKRITERRT